MEFLKQVMCLPQSTFIVSLFLSSPILLLLHDFTTSPLPRTRRPSQIKKQLSSDSSLRANMKLFLINYALMATMTALAAMVSTDAGPLPLDITLKPNATEVLAANGIWAPDLAAFAASKYNLDGVNFTAEGEKLTESGLDVNDLVLVTIGSDRSLATADKCDKCKLCLKACAAALLLWFLWVDSPSTPLPLSSP